MQAGRCCILLLLFAWLGASPAILGQASTPTIPAAPATSSAGFSAEPYVIRSFSSVMSMNADGTGTHLQTVSVTIQSDAALRQFGVISLPFASQSQSADFVYARVRRADGSTLVTSISDALEQPAPVTREAPFYSDLKSKDLPIKSLRLGDTLEWQSRVTTTHPEIPGQFWGQEYFISGAVILEEVHELRVPACLHPTVWTDPRAGASPSESTEDNQHVYRWRHADLNPTVGPQADAAAKAKDARLLTADEELDETKGKLPSIAWTTFPDWAGVGAWYRGLSVGRITPDAAIEAKVTELTAGKTSDLDKARAIYTYVSSQVRYVGVAFGIGRYQPHSAAEVFANQYGDCKDKHTLLASMLSAAGLHAEPVLIGAGVRFNPAVPSPASFNHLITRLMLDGHEVWLDSTAEVAPWRALVFAIRDQDALAIPSSAPAAIVHTPADLPFPAFETATVTGSLDASLTSDSKMVLTVRGDDEIVLRAVLRNVSPANYGVFVQQLVRNQGFGGTTSEPLFEHLDDASQPLVLSFRYHRVKDSDWGQNRITAAFEPISLASFTAQKPPTASIQLGAPRTETSTVEMTLPAGWSAELPDAVHARSAFATCDVTYRFAAGKLFAERRLVVLKSKVPAADYKDYQAWYDSAGASGVPFIQLIAPAGPANLSIAPNPGAPAASGQSPASDPRAAELVKKAGESIRTMDLEAARKALDEAKAINASERGLWMGYAAVAGELGKSDEGIADLRKELTYYPDEARVYRYLSMEQLKKGDREGALASLRAWVKAKPADPEAALALVQQLASSKRYEDALTEAQAAIVRIGTGSGDLTGLHLAAARALLQLGRKQEAASTLEPLLKAATEPDPINNIAYDLAQTGLNLDAAEAAQHRAIATLEAESADWNLDEAPTLLIHKQALLVAAWDTMAWILHAEGKDEEALGYAGAALRSSDHPVVRDHFVAIATALKTPAASAIAHQTNQQLRTFPLGPVMDQSAPVEVRMLIAAGKVLKLGTPVTNAYTAPADADASPDFPGAEERVKDADLQGLFPPGSKAHLVRRGSVVCHDKGCELVITPLGSGPS